MNKIVNKVLLAGDKLIPEIHLRQPRFTKNVCGTFTKTKDNNRKTKIKETGDSKYIYQNNQTRGACNMI